MTEALQIIGRSSSHFTRVPLIFAHELGIAVELVPIFDVTNTDAAIYAGNPALKMPTLRRGDGTLVFGAENICRTLAESSKTPRHIVWPEDLRGDTSRNAQELVWHGMAAQVQLVFGTMTNKLPADNAYFSKARSGFEGALQWLEAHWIEALGALPPRDLSLLEVTLFCLLEHIEFRGPLSLEPYPTLVHFTQTFRQWPSAQLTRYRFDTPPGA
jgi:glutathione S-transferase